MEDGLSCQSPALPYSSAPFIIQNQMSTEKSVQKSPPSILDCIGTDIWKEEVHKVIPKEIALDAFLRVARSTASDSKFANCDPKSFLLALLKCGRAGLYADGREAHLIAFGREVQAVFDVKGICSLAGRAGILVTPKLVHENDEFSVEEDDGTGKTKITHRVNYRAPRGAIQAVYSRAVMSDGRVDYEIMSVDEVEGVRQSYSRAKDSSPWKNSWGEMAKKTAIKRHSKRWDMSPEIRQALNADDDSLPEAQVKVKAPIFKSEQPKLPEPDKPLVTVRKLCESSGFKEEQIVAMMKDIGLADEKSTTLDEQSDVDLVLVLNGWADFAARLNGGVQ